MRMNAGWWWIDRWRKSTAYTDMTLEEQGAYRNLLDEATLRGGPIPNDERILAKACGDALAWKRVRPAVMARFTLKPDGWRNATCDEVLAESQRRSDKQKAYRNKRGNDVGNGNGNDGGNGDDGGGGNDVGNAIGNSASNQALPPDPDPDLSPDRAPDPGEHTREATRTGRDQTTRVQRFIDRYRQLHEHYCKVAYLGNPVTDYREACQLVDAFDDALLEKLTVYWLNDPGKFATESTRTIAKFRSRASKYAEELKARKLA